MTYASKKNGVELAKNMKILFSIQKYGPTFSVISTAQQNSQPNIAINSIITKFANNE